MIKCIALDLDQTLIDTEELKEFRDAGRWADAVSNFDKCSLYPGVLECLERAKHLGIGIAIVTNSKRSYAEALLNYFDISVDCLIAYGDMSRPKPDRAWFSVLQREMRVNREEVFFVGDSEVDHEAAKNARVRFASPEWSIIPETQVVSFDNLIELVTGVREYEPFSLIREEKLYSLGYYFSGSQQKCHLEIKKATIDLKDGSKTALDSYLGVIKSISSELPKCTYIVRALGHKELIANKNQMDFIGEQLQLDGVGKYDSNILCKSRVTQKASLSGSKECRERSKE